MKKFTSIFVTATVAVSALAAPNAPRQASEIERQAEILQLFRSTPAAMEGRIYYKTPEILKEGFSFTSTRSTDPVQAYIDGYGPLTPEVMSALKGKTIMTIPQLPAQAYAPSYEEGASMFNPSVTIHNTSDPDAEYKLGEGMIMVNFMRVAEEGSEMGFIFYSNIDEEESSWSSLPEGTYDVFGIATMYPEDPEKPQGLVALYKRVEMSEEDSHVDLYFDDAIHTVRINGLDPQGKPFPEIDEQDIPTIINSTIGLFLGSQSLIQVAKNSTLFRVPDLTDIRHEISQTLTYSGFELPTAYQSIIIDPIVSDIDMTVDYTQYREYSANFSITESEKDANFGGYRYSIGEYYDGNWGSHANQGVGKKQTRETVSFNGLLAKPVSTETDYAVSGYELASVSIFSDNYSDKPTVKSGGFTSEVSGEWMVYPLQTVTVGHRFSHEYYPELMIVEQPEKYFTKALFCVPQLQFSLDWSDRETIKDIYANYDFYGPYNERFNGMNPYDYVESVKLDGEEISLSSIVGSKIAIGGLYEFTFKYTDLLVNDDQPSSNVTTYGYVANNDWIQVPKMMMYQIRNEEGNIANELMAEESAMLYVGASGDSDYGCEVEVSVSPQDTDEWTPLVATVTDTHPSVPVINGYDLSGVEVTTDGWYKARVKVSSSYGCYVEETINHSFFMKAGSSLPISTVDTTDDAIYYNLQGQRVANPANGLYIKVQGGNGSKIAL